MEFDLLNQLLNYIINYEQAQEPRAQARNQ